MKTPSSDWVRTLLFVLVILSLKAPYSKADLNTFTSNMYAISAVKYKLVEGSTLIDDCTICGRPTYLMPIQGSFWLQQMGQTADWFAHYAVRDLRFNNSANTMSYSGKLNGTYRIGGNFALLQQMALSGMINNLDIKLDSGMVVPQIAFPWIEIDIRQIEPDNPLHVYSLHLVAVPCPRLWFSTETGFTPSSLNVKISDGDLLSTSGQILHRNNQLTSRLGIMPPVPDLGLDAVMLGKFSSLPVAVSRYRPIWFSLPQDVFSETLGMLHHGDLLSEQGTIVKSYMDFIRPFMPMPPIADNGLDAIARAPGGELLFSTRKNFFSEKLGKTISNGDLLSETGYVFKTSEELLSKFVISPTFAPIDFGLDAVYVWPHGEVWFSTKSSFPEQRYGMIGHGDLLSSYGKVVLRNRDLLEAFKPAEDPDDFGLDALEILRPNLTADLNEDGVVDLSDYSIFARSWMSDSSDNKYNTICDISDDNSIDILDAVEFFDNWLAEVE